MKSFYVGSVLLILNSGGTVLAQTPTIPAPVIEECMSSSSADKLPACLKEGAVAFELLNLVQSEEYYGSSAKPVVSSCAQRNDNFGGQWVCFQNAAEKAAETRKLIGLDQISDDCVAAISDGNLLARITEEHDRLRAQAFPDELFFGWSRYYPFHGCSDNDEGS